MKKMSNGARATLWLVRAAVALLIAAFGILHVREAMFMDRALSAESGAMDMGMITSPERAAALTPSVPEAENAAPLYRDLIKVKTAKSDPSKLISEWAKNPSPETLKAIEAHLRADAEFIALAEKAAAKPSCWFNRDFQRGYAMLLPELQHMKRSVQNFCLRATLAQASGKDLDALADLKRAGAVVGHMDIEQIDISILVALAGRSVLVRTLAPMAVKSPQGSAYRQVLSSLIKGTKPRSVTDFLRFTMLNDLLMLEQTTTKELRQKYGYGDMQVKPSFIFTSLFVGDAEGRLLVIEGHKKLWKLAADGADESDPAITAAELQIAKGMLSNPYSGEAYSQISDPEMGMSIASMAWSSAEKLEQSRLMMAVVERIVSSGGDPLKVKTDDLQPKSGSKAAVWRVGGKIHVGSEDRQKAKEAGSFILPLP